MRCQEKKRKRKSKPGDFVCKECGAVSAKKKRLCKPKKIKREPVGMITDKTR